jgi:hypothetical protein
MHYDFNNLGKIRTPSISLLNCALVCAQQMTHVESPTSGHNHVITQQALGHELVNLDK